MFSKKLNNARLCPMEVQQSLLQTTKNIQKTQNILFKQCENF